MSGPAPCCVHGRSTCGLCLVKDGKSLLWYQERGDVQAVSDFWVEAQKQADAATEAVVREARVRCPSGIPDCPLCKRLGELFGAPEKRTELLLREVERMLLLGSPAIDEERMLEGVDFVRLDGQTLLTERGKAKVDRWKKKAPKLEQAWLDSPDPVAELF